MTLTALLKKRDGTSESLAEPTVHWARYQPQEKRRTNGWTGAAIFRRFRLDRDGRTLPGTARGCPCSRYHELVCHCLTAAGGSPPNAETPSGGGQAVWGSPTGRTALLGRFRATFALVPTLSPTVTKQWHTSTRGTRAQHTRILSGVEPRARRRIERNETAVIAPARARAP